MAFTLSKNDKVLTLTAAKLRNLPAGLCFNSQVEWEVMRVVPAATVVVE